MVKIAVVQASCGYLTCVGPNDWCKEGYGDQMDGAVSWHIEAGYMPVATYWVEVEIPAVPDVTLLVGKTVRNPPHDSK